MRGFWFKPRKVLIKLSPWDTPGEKKCPVKSELNTSTCYISMYTLQNVLTQHLADIFGYEKSQVS